MIPRSIARSISSFDYDALRRSFDTRDNVVDIHLEERGAYHPEFGNLSSLLTDRQRQILQRAAEFGYYEIPRQVTHQDIADECGLSQSTVAEHLQKIGGRPSPVIR